MQFKTPWIILYAIVTLSCGGGRESPEPGTSGAGSSSSGASGDNTGSSSGATSGASGSSSGATSGAASSSGSSGSTPVSDLVFAVVGDTRPQYPDDPKGYPTDVITKIYQGVAASQPQPSFVVGTGDYQYSKATSPDPQLDIYLGARKAFAGPFYPTMGNHECTGATGSNCGAGTVDGTTMQYTGFLTKLLAPAGQTSPYYVIKESARDGSWTAKFVFVAANAWTADQGTWLEAQMGQATTYTFVVRHEPAYDTQAPGVAPSEAIMAKHPYTLALVGHTHTYRKSGAREVIIGNGGAPITGNVNYGWALVLRRADGAIELQMIDYTTAKPTPGLGFAVKADGSPA
jgi:hypothetical protein